MFARALRQKHGDDLAGAAQTHPVAAEARRPRRPALPHSAGSKLLTQADLEEVLQEFEARLEQQRWLRSQEESSGRRLHIARNNAAIFLIKLGVFALVVGTFMLIALGLDYLIWFTHQSLNGAPPSVLLPTRTAGVVTSAASGLLALVLGWRCRKARKRGDY